MNPAQWELYHRYSDAVINDTTLQTNKLGMPLNCFVVIDCNNKTCLVACALSRGEMEEHYRWNLTQLLIASRGVEPGVIFVDEDHAMDAALAFIFENTCILNCTWHFQKNVFARLSGTLGVRYGDFQLFLHQLLHALTPSAFDILWEELLSQFGGNGDGVVIGDRFGMEHENPLYKGTVGSYLKRMHSQRQHWGGPWVHAPFTAGTRSTQ